MPTFEEWRHLLHSENRDVCVRAAKALIKREDVPLETLLEILDRHSSDGLGAEVKRQLQKRNGPALLAPMLERLTASHEFQREVACTLLGESGNWSITPHLLPMLDDPHGMVRRAAAFALAALGDPSALAALRHQLVTRPDASVNVRWPIELAIRQLDPNTELTSGCSDA